ncbi:MAG: hypothetical protein GXP55_22935 [Deltaproteobacteria bacterium]|nr:hypothetical protein [Deltaproteobacteria bacterium]
MSLTVVSITGRAQVDAGVAEPSAAPDVVAPLPTPREVEDGAEQAMVDEAPAATEEQVTEREGALDEDAAPEEPISVPSPEEAAAASIPSASPQPRSRASSREASSPLHFGLHGYYRARYSWMGGVPAQRRGRWEGRKARFGVMRLRLEPEVSYGPNEDHPIAVLHTQFDGLDNVVFGDNARITRTPLFAADPSTTDINGFDLNDSFRLKRAWVEFLIPVGQIRVGRMPSQWGLGLLAHNGNGLGEWGDPSIGSTFDRVLFATRPLTVFNALTRGDTRETPLIYALAYDKLVADPVVPGLDPPDPSTVRLGPVSSSYEQRSTFPFAFVSGYGNDVQELINAVIWRDLDWNQTSSTDRLQLGFYYVWRWQKGGGRLAHLPTDAQASRIHILDWFWDMQIALGQGRPSFFTTGEIVTIQGRSNTISLAGGCDDTTGICNNTRADIWGGVARVGFTRPERWTATMEWGFASGDGELFNSNKLSVRPLHPDYRVGLLTYQVALKALTANGLGQAVRPLWSDGGVWNSQYFNPQFRITLLPGIEVHGGVLVSWAQKLLGTVYASERSLGESSSCHGFDPDCFIGIEGDLALRFRWGPDDLMWWDTEFGIMRIGQALSGPDGLSQDVLWTIQSRAAIQF